MLFNSLIFILYFFAILIAYRMAPPQYRKRLLLLASYGFYAAWDWRFLPLIWFSTLLDFKVGQWLSRENRHSQRKQLLWVSLIGNLSPLLFFKYYYFFSDNIGALLHTLLNVTVEPPDWNILLPVGISFYTFQTLSYSIDLYQRKIRHTDQLLDFALFVTFFPQLVAGPIEKARELLPQLQKLPPLKQKQLRYGIFTFLFGLSCKVIIADTASQWVDQVFDASVIVSPTDALLGIFLFAVQIYMDFSGYSLMAIGLAHCFGITLSTNFTQPYLSANIQEFWRRWHITLSSWLREYVYIPLGGNRQGKTRQYINLMLTMLIGGLWHGASWTFVVWGGLHGLWLITHRITQKYMPSLPKWSLPIQVIFTFVGTTAIWVFFRAKSIEQAIHLLGLSVESFVKLDGSTLLWHPFIYCILAMFSMDILQRYYKTTLFIRKWPVSVQYAILLVAWTTVLILLIPQKPQPFIYFQF